MKVSRSGFCEYLSRKKSDARIEREAPEGFVVEALERHKGRYGYRRTDRELRKSGIAVSEKRALRTMRKLGLAGKGATRKHRVQKRVEPGPPVEPGGVRFLRGRAQQASGGRHHLHTHRRGAALPRSRDRRLLPQGRGPVDVRAHHREGRDRRDGQAVGREGPPDDGGLVFHDGQGARYASRSLQRRLGSHGTVQSASRPGTPLDDAVAESFFKTLKRGVGERGGGYGTRDEAERDIFKCIEPYCNRVRMHSTPGYMSPVEYGRQYA